MDINADTLTLLRAKAEAEGVTTIHSHTLLGLLDIIDKLPETADHVRVVPGADTVWRRRHMGKGIFEWVAELASDRKHLVAVCYSTLAAAQAAREDRK